MANDRIDWPQLESLAAELRRQSLSALQPERLEPLERAVLTLRQAENWQGLLRLRETFAYFVDNESYNGRPVFRRLSVAALEAVERTDDADLAAVGRYYHQEGHYLHKVAKHEEAIAAFRRSEELFRRAKNHDFPAIESYYMMALCYRALNRPDVARQVLQDVLGQIETDNLWRAHPLTVLAWLEQDAGHLERAETLLEEALALHRRAYDTDQEQFMAVVQTLADLGEVKGILGKGAEAEAAFTESLALAEQDPNRAARQIGRTTLKYAQYYNSIGEYKSALRMLHDVEKTLGQQGGHFDSLWKIKIAQADAYFRLGNLKVALQNGRAALRMRRERDLSNVSFVLEYVTRMLRGIGPKR